MNRHSVRRRQRSRPETGETERAHPDALPLAGRDDELQALDDYLADALAGFAAEVSN